MRTKKTLYMETTGVAAEKTAGEIISALVTAGATQVNTEYEAGRIKGLRWIMRVNGQDRLFAMPARVDPIFKILQGRGRNTWLSAAQKQQLQEKAHRVAWRQLLRWVLAQLAMIECGMTEAGEVFFPYIQTAQGQSVFEVFKGGGLKMLAAGDERPQ